MPRTHVASAPGKLVLVGEYAVLDGAPAISAAVNIVATATLRPVARGDSKLHVANSSEQYGFSVGPGGALNWLAYPGDRGALLGAALKALAARGYLQDSLSPVLLELCTRSFYRTENTGLPQKIGIGSSAAMAVALTSVLQSFLGHEPEFDVCLDAHRLFQHGKGSGIDVATSWFGGVIAMQSNGRQVPAIEQLSWPQGLHVVPVWTGESASTPAMLQRLDKFKERSEKTCSIIMQRLVAASDNTCKHWRANAADDVIESLDEYGILLRELDTVAELGIWSMVHSRLNDAARQAGVGYKPSGAGGGDFGLAFSRDASRLENFLARVNAELITQPARLAWADTGLVVNGDVVARLAADSQ